MEAANVLLQRSYPEFAKQSKAIFIPEFFLPNCAAFVDGTPQQFSDRLEKSDMDKKEKQSLKVAARGDFGERQFFDELKKTFGNKDISMAILQGSKMIIPKINQIRKNDPNKAEHESDFIIINQEYQYIMSLEVKNKPLSTSVILDHPSSLAGSTFHCHLWNTLRVEIFLASAKTLVKL